jgi:hypothetical protein
MYKNHKMLLWYILESLSLLEHFVGQRFERKEGVSSTRVAPGCFGESFGGRDIFQLQSFQLLYMGIHGVKIVFLQDKEASEALRLETLMLKLACLCFE